jgi:hypothetical protein
VLPANNSLKRKLPEIRELLFLKIILKTLYFHIIKLGTILRVFHPYLDPINIPSKEGLGYYVLY